MFHPQAYGWGPSQQPPLGSTWPQQPPQPFQPEVGFVAPPPPYGTTVYRYFTNNGDVPNGGRVPQQDTQCQPPAPLPYGAYPPFGASPQFPPSFGVPPVPAVSQQAPAPPQTGTPLGQTVPPVPPVPNGWQTSGSGGRGDDEMCVLVFGENIFEEYKCTAGRGGIIKIPDEARPEKKCIKADTRLKDLIHLTRAPQRARYHPGYREYPDHSIGMQEAISYGSGHFEPGDVFMLEGGRVCAETTTVRDKWGGERGRPGYSPIYLVPLPVCEL